jgi:prepilin-type N-terminal cleavage/methylation domain-containing protein
MIGSTMKDRRGVSLVELVFVMLIISILAAVAQPKLFDVMVKAKAAEAISEMQLIRLAVFNFQTDNQTWPPEAGVGAVPPGLEPYLPEGFDLVQEGYMLDFDNWGGAPFTVGITLVTSDSILGRTTMEMMPTPKWNSGNKYTWIFE